MVDFHAALKRHQEREEEHQMTAEEMQGFQTFGSSTLVDNTTSLRIYVNQAEVFEFKQLIFRGINNSPDASPAMKELYDIITHGKVLQDYKQQHAPLTGGTPNKS